MISAPQISSATNNLRQRHKIPLDWCARKSLLYASTPGKMAACATDLGEKVHGFHTGKKMTQENLTFFVKYIFLRRNWYILNPRAQLNSNMYISYSGFPFLRRASCFLSTEVTRSLFYEAYTKPFYCKSTLCNMHVIKALFYCHKIFV